ncbi:MAG TPA: ABC-three component system protein [Chryseosolibacter sp.]
MIGGTKQEGIDVTGTNNKVVAGDDNSTTHIHPSKRTRLSILFEDLKQKFNSNEITNEISEDLNKFTLNRDTVGLEQKLKDGQLDHLLDDAMWLKQEYAKKLTKYQFLEPAQEIHAFILSLVLEKFRTHIYPLIRSNASEAEVFQKVSSEIIDPIVRTIQEDGCSDIMGLTPTDITGMVYFLTGKCHIKWKA